MEFTNHTATPVNVPAYGVRSVDPGDNFWVPDGPPSDALIDQGWTGPDTAAYVKKRDADRAAAEKAAADAAAKADSDAAKAVDTPATPAPQEGK